MSTHTQVEAAQTITGETVTTALQDHCLRAVPLHNTLNDRLKDALVRGVIDTIAKREVDCIMLALADTDVAELTGTREVLAILVERNRHDTISRVEGLFDAIAVVNINIDIKNTLLETQQLKDSENNICQVLDQSQGHINFKHLTIDVTEATCFTLLGVVQTTSPVNSNIALVAV